MRNPAGQASHTVKGGGLLKRFIDARVNHILLNPCYKHESQMETLAEKVLPPRECAWRDSELLHSKASLSVGTTPTKGCFNGSSATRGIDIYSSFNYSARFDILNYR